jgi:hypothetical protein
LKSLERKFINAFNESNPNFLMSVHNSLSWPVALLDQPFLYIFNYLIFSCWVYMVIFCLAILNCVSICG